MDPILSGDMRHCGCSSRLLNLPVPVFERSSDESAEQRMRLQRLRFELGMELAAEIPGMAGKLANLHVDSVGSFAGQAKPVLLQDRFILAIKFEAMAVAFADFTCSVGFASIALVGQQARIGAQAHRSAQLIDT